MMTRISYTKPSITKREIEYATDAAKNGWGEECYEYIVRFEEMFKVHLGVRWAIATSSCTGALTMGLAALGIGPGDEIILADTNWIATASAIIHLGAKPVFVDIKEDSWCVDPMQVEKAITPRTKAIIAVHIYGNLCEMDSLQDIGLQYNLPIIEDAAEAIGSVFSGKRAGAIGRFGVFSFHGTKTVTTGEGGMFVTNDETLFDKVLTLSNHGRSQNQEKQFWSDVVGYKYKLSNIQAAIGCAQMERVAELVDRKRQIFKYYENNLLNLPGIRMNPEYTKSVNGYWMPTIVFDKQTGITREKLQKRFIEKNIDARVFFWPLSSLPPFEPVWSNKIAWDIPGRALNLPSYHDMTIDDQNRVIDVIVKQVKCV